MSEEPKKIFDFMDIETEPTDEQLAELMEFVAEEVRALRAIGAANLKRQMDEALADAMQRAQEFSKSAVTTLDSR
jgi:hypothetical protein